MKKNKSFLAKFFNTFSNVVTRATGTPTAFLIATCVILIWGITGPIFGFSDTWQLVINTGTTIITFLMVFVIQHSQNKDTKAIQLKLNELIAANCDASNRLVSIEDLTDEELNIIKKFYTHLAQSAKKESNVFTTHSLDEAKLNSANKNTNKIKQKIKSN
ncbi:MAG: low affinity iron permease family protein [Chitinophagaceae bacterium]|jgi:low affinity Fe/Cu permease|nr:low affinity iron permease family protein [Chitinophagaceae bacterium]